MVVTLTESPGDGLQGELDVFEAAFEYPLDTERTFRISHGPHYLRFFQAMGEASCFVARKDGAVGGVLTTVARQLRLPEAGTVRALYVCDLKVAPGSARPGTMFRLAASALAHHAGRERAAYSIVMQGTEKTPDAYTGSLGVPRFAPLAEVAILRLPAIGGRVDEADVFPVSEVAARFSELADSVVHTPVKPRFQGGRFEPLPLLEPDGRACGVLEDTLSSKRLIGSDGELLSAHLSSFAYTTPESGGRVVRSALARCRERGIPALFLALPAHALEAWLAHNRSASMTLTGATVYGHGLPAGLAWNINTSEV